MSETSLSASRLLQELQLRLLQAKNKRSELLVKFDAAYPLVREVDEEIADTTAAFEKAEQVRYHDTAQGRDPAYEARKQDLAKTTADIAYHKAQIQALDSSIARQQKQLADLDTKAIQQSQLVREVKLNESSYLLYSNKREQERTSDVLDKRRIVNVAIAVPPSVPVLPAHSPMLIITIGLLSSILLAVGAAFLAEYLDSSFRDPAEVTKTLEIPVLAWVPKQAVSNGISRN